MTSLHGNAHTCSSNDDLNPGLRKSSRFRSFRDCRFKMCRVCATPLTIFDLAVSLLCPPATESAFQREASVSANQTAIITGHFVPRADGCNYAFHPAVTEPQATPAARKQAKCTKCTDWDVWVYSADLLQLEDANTLKICTPFQIMWFVGLK